VGEQAAPAIRSNPGMVMGTVGYMAPEQARGEEADGRADLFAFGVIFYEMLVGERPFRGASAAETMSAILNQEAPELPTSVGAQAPGLGRVIGRCLEKQANRRFQSASDLGFALEALTAFAPAWVSSSGSATIPAQPSGPNKQLRTGRGGWLGWLLAGVFMLSTVGLAVAYFNRTIISSRVVPFTSFPGQKSNPIFSPDGNQIAFIWDGDEGEPGLYIKLIDAGEPLRLAANLGNRGFNLAWSPDGRSIAFVRNGINNGIYSVPALGGPERKLTDMTGAFAWSPDGKTLAVSSSDSPNGPLGIFLLTLGSGEKRKLTSSQPGSFGDTSPSFSPDGRTLAFIRNPSYQVNDIYLVPVTGGEPRRLTFDNLELNRSLSWTADGQEVIFSSPRGGLPSLWRVSVAGDAPRRVTGIGEYAFNPSIARQGNRLAYVYNKVDRNIWRVPGPNSPTRESGPLELITSTRDDTSPQFSSDGKKIVFVSDRSGNREIWMCESDGQTPVQLTNFGGSHTGSPRWSPDGRLIAFDSRPEGHSSIYVIDSNGGAPRRFSNGTSEDIRPSWSSDGRWVYFGSLRSGDWQIWRMPSGGGTAIQITKNGGYEAFGSRDGKYVYYTRQDPGIWRVPAEGGEEVRVFDQGTWGNWALLDQGICVINRQTGSTPVIEYFNFATRQLQQIARLDKSKAPQGNLATSSDGHWILYWQLDHSDNDIMLVEDFH
jgi:Tol biopolymer transport system component